MPDVGVAPDTLTDRIRSVISAKLMVSIDDPDLDLLATGTIDSVGLVELLLEMEQVFETHLPVENIELEDLRTVNRIANVVARQLAAPLQP